MINNQVAVDTVVYDYIGPSAYAFLALSRIDPTTGQIGEAPRGRQ